LITDQTLVLVPGLDGTGDLFKPLLQVIPPEVDTVIIEYPRDKVLSKNNLAEIVRNQIPRNKPIVILAESFSGPLVINLLKHHPFDLKGVVFCATFARSPRKILLNLIKILPLSYLLRLPIPDSLLKYFCVGVDASKELIFIVKEAIRAVNPEVLAERLRILANIDESDSIRALANTSCSFIQALDDKLVPKHCLKDFINGIPNLKITAIPGSHFILQAKPKECWNIIKQI